MKDRARVVVIGGGLAGAAAAWGLARRGHRVILFEREERPGVHASGRNAGMIRRLVAEPAIATLAREGARLLGEPPADLARVLDAALVRRTGSVLLAAPPEAAALRPALATAQAAGLGAHEADPRACALHGLRPLPGATAFVTPEDGVGDPHAVLSALLRAARAAGARVECDAPARVRAGAAGAVGVETRGERFVPADVVVNAAGPWAEDLARAAGASPPPLSHYRRHLFYTGPLEGIDPDAGWVWDVSQGFYARPESAGLLLCACDEEARPPEDARPDAAAALRLAEKAARAAPRWSEHPVARLWAGLRSFAPDRLFVIGWDAGLRGLFHLTALGGHGLTVSLALAEPVALAVEGRTPAVLAPFAPTRLQAVPS